MTLSTGAHSEDHIAQSVKPMYFTNEQHFREDFCALLESATQRKKWEKMKEESCVRVDNPLQVRLFTQPK